MLVNRKITKKSLFIVGIIGSTHIKKEVERQFVTNVRSILRELNIEE